VNTTALRSSRDYTVLFYHVDQKHDLSISSLFDCYTEIALKNTVQAGFDFEYLEENNLKWILYKMKINVNRYPRLNENIRVSTWGQNIIKFNAFRKFELVDENGEILSTGEGIFLLVKADTMRPVRIPDEMFNGYGVERNKKDRIEIESLKEKDSPDYKKEFSVNYADLDYNQHATSARYTDWALETIPYEIRTGYDLSELTINYFKELLYSDPVLSACSEEKFNKTRIFHHAIYSRDEKPATLMKSVWKKRSTS